MNIINNLSGNHYQRILDISKNADTIYIISPFLMESFDTLFCEFKGGGINHIHLITTLKNNDMDLLRKANALHSFCSLCVENDITFDIYIDNKLHGKIYIASKNSAYTCGMLTSANFTESGLNRNHEWGVWIDDSHSLEILIKEVFSVCSKPLSKESISNIIKKVDDYFKIKPEPEQTKPDISISEFIDFGTVTPDKGYFIKPVGVSDNPFPETAILNSDIAPMRFSKRKPRAVQVGDILICYAVGSTKLLGYFEVISLPVYSGNNDDRWPWSVQAKNLCSSYSQNWVIINHILSRAKDEFILDEPVTYVGWKTLGALNRGADKIRLSESFAKHLIQIIEKDAKEFQNKNSEVFKNGSLKTTGIIKKFPIKPVFNKNVAADFDMSGLDSIIIEIAGILAQLCLTAETPIITYGDLAKQLSMPVNPRNLDQPLGHLSDFCKENGLPLLSVIVVNQDTLSPGPGFFKYFFPQAKRNKWDSIYIEQLNLIKDCKQWDKLLNSANSHLR